MFDKLWKLICSEDNYLSVFSSTIYNLSDIIKHLEENYSKDHDAYDAAIDTICQILQEHKSKKQP